MTPLQDNIQIFRIFFCSFRIYLLCGYAMEWNFMTCKCQEFSTFNAQSQPPQQSDTVIHSIFSSHCQYIPQGKWGLIFLFYTGRNWKNREGKRVAQATTLECGPQVSRSCCLAKCCGYPLQIWTPQGTCVDQGCGFLTMFLPYWGISVMCNARMMLKSITRTFLYLPAWQ